jgi:peroxiredoxin
MLKTQILCAALFLIFQACSLEPPLSGTIELDADSAWKPMVYLIDPVTFDGIASSYFGTVVDSAGISSDGTFAFREMPESEGPVYVQLAVQKTTGRHANALENTDLDAANYFPLIWDGRPLHITAEADHLQRSFAINTPSQENAAILRLRDIRYEAFGQFLSDPGVDDHHETTLLESAKALHNYRAPMIAFAAETPYLLPALTAIRWVSVDEGYERVPEFLYSQCQKWQDSHPDHPWVMQLCAKADKASLPLLTGDRIPDFPLPMQDGDTIALTTLLGNRLTLLDLWASWCAPCRRENRDVLVPLWDKHHADGFQIIGYALDGSSKAWHNAIEKDGAGRWLHASHLRGDDAPLLDALRIQTIPANFLIDADGIVIAKNLHGEDLRSFVEQVMEK